MMAGAHSGAQLSFPYIRRAAIPMYGLGPNIGASITNWSPLIQMSEQTEFNGTTNIRLPEGRGIAVLLRSPSGTGVFGIAAQFHVETVGEGGTTYLGYARSRVTNA